MGIDIKMDVEIKKYWRDKINLWVRHGYLLTFDETK